MSKTSILYSIAMAWYLTLALVVVPPSRQAIKSNASVVPRPTPTQLAEAFLRSAPRLYAAQVGIAGITPPEVLAWRIILRDSAAKDVFERLFHEGSRAAQVYALAGLEWTGSSTLAALSAELRGQGGDIDVTIGCVPFTQPITQVLNELSHWSAEFVSGRLLPHPQ